MTRPTTAERDLQQAIHAAIDEAHGALVAHCRLKLGGEAKRYARVAVEAAAPILLQAAQAEVERLRGALRELYIAVVTAEQCEECADGCFTDCDHDHHGQYEDTVQAVGSLLTALDLAAQGEDPQ
jgi:hypothetical protein